MFSRYISDSGLFGEVCCEFVAAHASSRSNETGDGEGCDVSSVLIDSPFSDHTARNL